MRVCMRVTKDKYELPIDISESTAELARRAGRDRTNVQHEVCMWRTGTKKRSEWVSVDIEDWEDEPLEIDGKEYIEFDEFADKMMASDALVYHWMREGMPVYEDVDIRPGKRRYKFCLEDCHAWYRGEC